MFALFCFRFFPQKFTRTICGGWTDLWMAREWMVAIWRLRFSRLSIVEEEFAYQNVLFPSDSMGWTRPKYYYVLPNPIEGISILALSTGRESSNSFCMIWELKVHRKGGKVSVSEIYQEELTILNLIRKFPKLFVRDRQNVNQKRGWEANQIPVDDQKISALVLTQTSDLTVWYTGMA